jgi:hypothetical protein
VNYLKRRDGIDVFDTQTPLTPLPIRR